uniref:Protein FAM221A n=1 Tax=Kryptolebias marmoratus TaxID=37003 RepID=A0A3Q3BAN8_KRYMA
MDPICLDKSALKAVDDYWEYRRYKQHKTDWEVVPSERPLALPCRVGGCHCSAFLYVPRLGSNPVRCRCKHLPQDHSEATDRVCNKCNNCSGFQSPYTCGCGQPCSAHQTLVETKPERQARGQPVGRDVPYAAMGGLTSFSSLLDGYLALEAACSDRVPATGGPVSNISSMRNPINEALNEDLLPLRCSHCGDEDSALDQCACWSRPLLLNLPGLQCLRYLGRHCVCVAEMSRWSGKRGREGPHLKGGKGCTWGSEALRKADT